MSGSDISAAALELAAANGVRLGLQVQWLRADLLQGVPDEFQAVLCNPPYVAESARGTLAPEIVRHEPPLALFAADDGMGLITALLSQMAGRKQIRWVAIEVGRGQAQGVSELTSAAGFDSVAIAADLAGIERVVSGERSP